ncbi:MAG: Xaa-Pro aminopeptidase [Porticoccaceae bacterium]
MVSEQELSRRRTELMALMAPNSIAIVPAAPEQVRSRDTYFPYRQDSDFFYLCGFPEPEAVLVLIPGREQGEFVLFCRERDRAREIWDGYRAGPEGACEKYAADDAFPINDIDEILPGLIEGKDRVYYAIGKDQHSDARLMEWVNNIRRRARAGASPPAEFVDLDHLLHELRLFKSAAELKIMHRSAQIAARAHARAMSVCKPGMYEYQLQAEIEHEFAMAGARYPAYGTIVGGGANGCILHYVENSAPLNDGDLVLIDAGCELDGYASDITRTFPVGGRFSPEQKAIYEIVLEAQRAAIDAAVPGNHWNDPHDATVQVIVAGLLDLGLLKGSQDELIEKGAYTDFYMHRAGHWLGMDVHDVGDYKVDQQWRLLEPGMVMTVEPGIYIAPDNRKVARKWRGIGIRIEDNVAITRKGNQVLTVDAPKTIADIEALMAG